MKFTAVTALLVVSVAMSWSAVCRASASCSRSCSGSVCQFTCSSEHEYVVFGKVYESGTYKNVGVCFFDSNGNWSKGTCRGCVYANVTSGIGTYQVNAGAGNDVVRLAETDDDGEACAGTNYTIVGENLPDVSDIFVFYGQNGNDILLLCASTTPEVGLCIDNLAKAYGDANPDLIYGSINDDYIQLGDSATTEYAWGFDGDDEIYGGAGDDYINGGEGNDWIVGNTGNDTLYGGGGYDDLFGNEGNDILYGGLGCDSLDGGTQEANHQDQCICGETGETANTAWGWTRCESTSLCYVCFFAGGAAEGASCEP